MLHPPLKIAFEGMDAAGKKTHSQLTAEKLGGVVYSFPDYTTPSGALIADHLHKDWQATYARKDHKSGELDAMVFQAMQTVNRLEVAPRIRQNLAEGTHVVFDRYWLSGYVYGKLDGLDGNWVRDIQESLPQPDMWILLDVPLEESVARRPERRDRYEEDQGFMRLVREEYLKAFNVRPEVWYSALREHLTHVAEMKRDWIVVNAVGSKLEVHSRIVRVIESRYGRDVWRGRAATLP